MRIKKCLAIILCITLFMSSLAGVVMADHHEIINESIANPTIFSSVYAQEKYIAVGEGGAIYTSDDSSQWTKQTINTNNNLNDIIYANNKFVIVGSNGTILISNNGENWTERNSGTTSSLNAIIFEQNLFVAVGDNGVILTSSDTGIWTQKTPVTTENLHDIVYAKAKYIAVGNNGTILSSIAGNSWSILTSNTNENLYAISTDESSAGQSNSRILVGGGNGILLMSFNADSWSVQTSPTASAAIMDMIFDNNQFVLVGLGSVIMTSSNGISWTPKISQSSDDWYCIFYLNNEYFCFGESCTAARSTDTVTWTIFSVGGIPNLNQIIYVNNQFIAVGDSGTIVTSADGNSWVNQLPEVSNNLNSVAYGNNIYVVVGQNGAIYTSPDSITWSKNRPQVTSENLNSVCFGNGQFIAVGSNGMALSSQDGINWSIIDINSENDFNAICYGDSKFVIVGASGTILASSSQGWSTINTGGANLYDVGYIDNQFVAVGASHTIKYSSNATTWNASTVNSTITLRGLAANKKIAVGSNSILGADSVSEWNTVLTTTKANLKSVAYGIGKYVAVGDDIVSFIADMTAPTITLTEQAEYTSGNVEITVEIEDESEIALQKWAVGSQSVDYFANNGTTFVGNSFEVTQNGVYTVYAKDSGELETVASITVTKQDTAPPSAPDWAEHYANVGTPVLITWDSVFDSTLGGYAIYKDSVLLGTVMPNITSYVDEISFNGSSSYAVAAFDRAGNYSTFTTSVYQNSMIIDGFYSGITAGDIRQNICLDTGETVQIYDSDNQVSADSDLIGAQSKIIVSLNGTETETYLIALYGDLNCDGFINSSDVTMVNQLLLDNYDGRNIAHLIADINNDHTLNILDLVKLRMIVQGRTYITQNRLCGVSARFSSIIDNEGPVIQVSSSQEWGTQNTLTISASDTKSGVFRKTISNGTNGHDITGSTEIVTKNGIYTITAFDNSGNQSVESVIVNHIIETETMGAYEKAFDDFEVASKGIDIRFTRYYNSMNEDVGLFGKGWQSSYEIRCVDYDNDGTLNLKKVIFPGEDPVLFAYENGTYTSGTSRMKLANKTGGGYTLHSREGITYQFNADGYLTSINDRIGNTVNLNLTSNGKIQSISDASSRQYIFEYGNNGLISKITDPAARTFRYQYNDEGQLFNYINPLKTVETKYMYNSNGYLVALRDAFDNTIESVEYLENSNRIKKITDADESYISYAFNDENKTATETDIFGKTTTYTYNQYMQLIAVANNGETTTTSYYNAYGDVNTITDPDGKTTQYQYDTNGNVTQITYTNGEDITTEEYTYNASGDMLSSKDTEGNRKYYEYDTYGKITTEITPKNGTDVYDENLSDEDDFIFGEYEYYKRPAAKKDLLSGIYYSDDTYIEYAYDNNGYIILEETESDTVQYIYNVIGWIMSEIDSDNIVTAYVYDYNHNTLRVKKDVDVVTRTVYDSYGRVKQIIEGIEYNSAYDGLQNTPAIDTYMDSNFEEVPVGTRYYYGNNQKLSSVKMSEYGIYYNADGTVGNIKVQNNDLVSYDYSDDVKKLLTQTEYSNNQSISYAYNNDGNIVSITIDGANQPAFTYSYEDGKLVSKVDHLHDLQTDYTENSITVSQINGDSTLMVLHQYEVDEENNTVTETVGADEYVAVQSDNEDEFVLGTDDSIVKTYGTDANNNTVTTISKTVNKVPSTLITATSEYGQDKISALTTVLPNDSVSYTYEYTNDLLTKIKQGNTEIYRYTYNDLDQLIRVDDVQESKTMVYEYDGVSGNITAKKEYALTNSGTTPSAPVSTQTFTYGDSDWSDKLTAIDNNTITYDDMGNPLSYDGWTYVWEAGQQLKRMTKNGSVIDYKYDDNGIRISKTVDNITTNYTTVDGRITSQKDGTHALYFRYDHNNSLVGFNLDGTEYLYLKNGQGDIEGILDTTGALVVSYTYDAWGKVLSCTGTLASTVGTINPMRYRDYYLDSETGYYYLQSRYYNPDICRFINADKPAILTMSVGKILNANLFTFCKNNPIMYIDYSGLWAEYYSGFKWTNTGFNLNVQLSFLSRSFCVSYSLDIIRLRGQWYWWGKGYKKMSSTRIAQELWFHALIYYVGSPIKSVLNTVGVSWSWLNSKLNSAKYMEINNDDSRSWVFALTWWSAYTVRTLIRTKLGYGFPYAYIHI